MGKSRGAEGLGSGGRSKRVPIIVGLVVLAFIGGFAALVIVDRQQAPPSKPAGVEEFDVGPSGQHTRDNVDYTQNPPAGGKHNPVWQNAGFYTEPIRNENAVHTMEHGGVWITYSPDLPQDQKDAIQQMVEGQECMLASPYDGLPSPIVASAWGAQMQLQTAEDPGLEDFIHYYRRGPQTPEPGAACTGGIGDPS